MDEVLRAPADAAEETRYCVDCQLNLTHHRKFKNARTGEYYCKHCFASLQAKWSAPNPAPSAARASKPCAGCNTDLLHQARYRDGQGRYLCETCSRPYRHLTQKAYRKAGRQACEQTIAGAVQGVETRRCRTCVTDITYQTRYRDAERNAYCSRCWHAKSAPAEKETRDVLTQSSLAGATMVVPFPAVSSSRSGSRSGDEYAELITSIPASEFEKVSTPPATVAPVASSAATQRRWFRIALLVLANLALVGGLLTAFAMLVLSSRVSG